MKALHFAVLLLIVWISSGEALRCNRCVPRSPGGRCTNTVETCSNPFDVCARVLFRPPLPISYFKRCMKEADAAMLRGNPSIDVYTCSMDLCN
uniref:Snake toxin/toxin-like domain-containing protein n=1 Tax=Myripristis murdjan TaxID=586833 RepID=A0A667XBB8_9TELE